ncbi:2-hydroxymuconic semialdehyde hydrolase [Photobacterium marinum]|uniref:2-hydroxymuconic semialdehyde hydrolase n=1 Tax=Photobacterium marinum TaxID=1056511 RepID=L8JDU2_9GAMM|nr:alpha/beta hydrolase [Photobacterium marinum]ELR65679.1 2-hydroxymuconic semialdehyde hydrolase [Photobacterium marinum]
MNAETISKLYRRIILLFFFITLTGCELVGWKAEQDKNALQEAGYTEHFLPLEDGGVMKFWVGGNGKPLLLLHGFGGTAISTWKNEMLSLNKDYMVIAPDLAWFGDSYSKGAPNLETQTDAVWQILDSLNINKVSVAGISYGGFVTYNMMTTPERIEKSVIIASPGPLFNDQDVGLLCERAEVDKPEQLFVPQNSDEVRRLFNHVFYKKKQMPDFIADQIYQSYFEPWREEKQQLITSLINDRTRINNYPVNELPPSMLVWGDSDQIFPLQNGLRLSKYLNTALVVIPETGHGVTNEQPELVTKLLSSFI